MILANLSNGLPYRHDATCWFQSCHGHHARDGYFRLDAMPYDAIIHILKGGTVEIVDATHKNKPLTDAQKYGVATWCLVFNRALRMRGTRVCNWQTLEMQRAANNSRHKKTVSMIRRLERIYGHSKAAAIGENVILTCYRQIDYDDKPEKIKDLICQ